MLFLVITALNDKEYNEIPKKTSIFQNNIEKLGFIINLSRL